MIFQSLTRGAEIGANSYLLEMGGTRLVLDSGLHPKIDGMEATPDFSLLSHDSIDAIYISHSHLDHIGTLPWLFRQQPSAEIIMSPDARELTPAMLHNCVNVMCRKVEEEHIANYPLFTHKEVNKAMEPTLTPPLKKPFYPLPDSDLQVTLFPAGHVLGATGALFELEDENVFYTGDVNFLGGEIVKPADFPSEGVDTLIMECTRGAHPSSPDYTREKEIEKLARAIRDTHKRGGSVLLPLFALGRSQEMCMLLHRLKQESEIPDMPVYMGGLSAKITRIFDENSSRSYRHHGGFEILKEIDLHIPPPPRGKKKHSPGSRIPLHDGAIYALSSGMISENTLSYNVAPTILQNPDNSVIFVGYSDPSTPAGLIRAVGQGGTVAWSNGGDRELRIECPIHELDFSGHADRESLLQWAVDLAPQRILLVHGDEEAMAWFKQELSQALPECEIIIPQPGEIHEFS